MPMYGYYAQSGCHDIVISEDGIKWVKIASASKELDAKRIAEALNRLEVNVPDDLGGLS